MINRRIFWLSVFISFAHEATAQRFFLGFRSSCVLGSHEQRFGVGLNATVQFSQGMLSLGNDGSFYIAALGGRRMMWESRAYVGGAWYVNDQTGIGDFELGTLKNPFSRSSSLGYAYVWYWDNASTQQSSGAFRGEYQGHSVFFENDFLAGLGKDRFRTATFRYRYRSDFWSVHTGFNLWTGETAGVQVQSRELKGKTRFFKDLSSLAYGTTSHGILFGGIRYGLKGQTLGLDVGIDSEHFRNAVQNELAHHALWHRKNPEKAVKYPMLDRNGNPTWDPDMVRKALPYFRLLLSED